MKDMILPLLRVTLVPLLEKYMMYMGLGVGLLILVYGVFLLSGLYYECSCQRANLASFIKAYEVEECTFLADHCYDKEWVKEVEKRQMEEMQRQTWLDYRDKGMVGGEILNASFP